MDTRIARYLDRQGLTPDVITVVPLTGDAAISVAKLWAKLDESDDIQKVYCNAELPDDIMEEYGP